MKAKRLLNTLVVVLSIISLMKGAVYAQTQPTAPSTFDWRNYNGLNYVTGVRHQRDCGSCWAFAMTAALESYWLIKNNTPGFDLDLSEQILIFCGGICDEQTQHCTGTCGGAPSQYELDFMVNKGLPLESLYPYRAKDENTDSTGADDYCDRFNLNGGGFRLGNYYQICNENPSVEGIKSALREYGPLFTHMEVYKDFYNNYDRVRGIYSFDQTQHPIADKVDGHFVLIVGYNDIDQYFIVKNSAGAEWGENGFFRIAYSEVSTPVQFGYGTFAFRQAPCTSSISPANASFSISGGSGSITVTTGCSNYNWSAKSSASWIKITSGTNGTGNGTITYTVYGNNTFRSRKGTISVAGKLLKINQAFMGTKY